MNEPQQGWYCRECGFLAEEHANYDFTCFRCGSIIFWHKEDDETINEEDYP